MFKIDYDDDEDSFCISRLSAHYFLCYYLPKNKFTQDIFSKDLLKFKDNNVDIVQKWKLWTVEEFENVGIHFDYIVRALGNKELEIPKREIKDFKEEYKIWLKPLDYIGYSLQKRIGGKYIPYGIRKKKNIDKISLGGFSKRAEQVHNAYEICEDCPDLEGKTILIIDDVLTAGLTSEEIARCIKKKFSNVVCILFTLTKTGSSQNDNDNITKKYFEDTRQTPK